MSPQHVPNITRLNLLLSDMHTNQPNPVVHLYWPQFSNFTNVRSLITPSTFQYIETQFHLYDMSRRQLWLECALTNTKSNHAPVNNKSMSEWPCCSGNVEIHLFKPKPDKKMSLTRIQPEKKREKTSAGSKSNMFASKTFPASSNPKNALVSLSPSPSPRVQSQTEGEPTAHPPENSVSASKLWQAASYHCTRQRANLKFQQQYSVD